MKIGLLGMGTVGGGVRELAERLPDVKIARILERVHTRPEMTNHIEDILRDDSISLIVETMGGLHPAYEFAVQSLESGRHFVTANKLLVSAYGRELQALARRRGVGFLFGAACGGGIPYLSNLAAAREGDHILRVGGILNGTTNYMLSKMSNEHLDYDEVLKEAQAKGYAESDPTADVGGLDAARKVVILASIAFNTRISLKDVLVEGIENIEACDIKYAQNLGYAVKLLGIAKNDPENGITVCVKPTMLPLTHPLAGVNGVYNAVFVNGDAIGEAMFLGMGAGRLPTASSVVGDIIEIARDIQSGSTGRISCTCFKEKKLCPPEKMSAPAYIRLQVLDQPGALAAIAAAFGAQNVSLRNVIQQNAAKGQKAEIVVITHSVSESNLQMALQILKVLPVVEKVSCVIRVEDSSLA